MAGYRTIGKGKNRRVIKIEDNSPRASLSRSSSGKSDQKWSAREFLRQKYGEEAFNPDGSIKLAYLDYAIYEAERDHHITLQKRLERTRRLREAQTQRQVKKMDEEERKHRDETYIHAHESHSRTGKEEEVEGHEMKLPSYEGGASTKLTTEDRRKLPDSAFAEPGKRAYPVPSQEQLEKYLGWSKEKARKGAERHAINALARAEQHAAPEEKERIRRKIDQNVPEVKGATAVQGFIPTEEGKIYIEKHEQPRFWVPAHESQSKDGKAEHIEGHFVDAHEVSGYDEEMNRRK